MAGLRGMAFFVTAPAVCYSTMSGAAQFEAFENQPLGGPYEAEIDARTYKTPTEMVKAADYPVFNDDYDFRGMKLAIRRQLKRYASKDLSGKIVMGGKTYPLSKARESLEEFERIIDEFLACAARASKPRCYEDLNGVIRAKFNVFKPKLVKKDPRFGQKNFALFTGYNTYHLEGRLAPDAEFKHAIYARPRDSRLAEKTRVDIDFEGALKGLGLELVYVKSLFDIYMMHVQGSGKITVTDPSNDPSLRRDFFLEFDGTNKQRWEFISLYMAKKGYITNGSIPSQRKFLHAHPEREKEIFGQCPSYVFLKPTPEDPVGSDSVPMTDNRVIAQDNATYPFKGLIAFIESRRAAETGNYDMEQENKAEVPFIPFSRFVLDQDTGGAINGKARADIYFGSDAYAMFASMYQAETGRIHYLLLK